MNRSYDDLTSRLGPPLWWDMHAVPRYVEFHPEHCGVYDDFVALVELACQGCQRRLLCSVEIARFTHLRRTDRWEVIMPTAESPGDFDRYGDPPIHGAGCIGCTMGSGIYRIVEFWIRDHERGPTWMTWVRHQEYEFDYGAKPFGGESLGGA